MSRIAFTTRRLRLSLRPKNHVRLARTCADLGARTFWSAPGDKANEAKATTPRRTMATISRTTLIGVTATVIGASLVYILYENDYVQPLPPTKVRSQVTADRVKARIVEAKKQEIAAENAESLQILPFAEASPSGAVQDTSAWASFTNTFSLAQASLTDIQWTAMVEGLTNVFPDYIVPDYIRLLPGYIRKLQIELSMAPGSLADEIWQEAHDPYINPEIEYAAKVRVSEELCDEEKDFREKRKLHVRSALAKYLGLPEESVHPDDVPTIAIVGSGGGLRALVAGTGSLLASSEAGLWDCVTYTAGVSGSCWLQTLFNSSLGGRRIDKMVDHLKARIGLHIAYPPVALQALNSAPTNKFLLSGFVEKLKGDPQAEFGLVDVYGLLLAARLLVPKGEVGVDARDLKISNQREYIKHGEQPMPIYTAVRHEIPIEEVASEQETATDTVKESTKARAKREAWFQWFEFTPFEFFCEEFSAGIPMWAVGRKFDKGNDVPVDGLRVPEYRLPLLLGVFGSAFCATLSHYYKEVRPLIKGLTGFGGLDGMIEGRNDDLSKVHPIDPASIPNFAFGMQGLLPDTTPESIYKNEHLQLMDAGMSNNLPIYPLLRPGREVDVLIAFDASADIKTENWLSVADGYARQRGIKGWPIGSGWPKGSDTAEQTAEQLDDARASTAAEATQKLAEARTDDHHTSHDSKQAVEKSWHAKGADGEAESDSDDLGYCTVWVGTTQEREYDTNEPSQPQPKSKAVMEDWQLMEPDAGITVVYFPFLANPKVEGVDPVTSDFMSTWNFVYTPEDIDKVVALARANFEEGRERTRQTVRAVYERKRRLREEAEEKARAERWRRKLRLGVIDGTGEGDHFS